jgi:hypothetical protein
VSLLIVPMFYVWFDDLNLWRRRVFGRKDPVAATEPARDPGQPEPATAPAAP